MKKIINPWKDVEGYLCFACSPNNPSGLHMEFYEEGDDIVSLWKPTTYQQGWLNTSGQTHLNLLGFLTNIHYFIPHPTFSL
jgi:hypothetical protein